MLNPVGNDHLFFKHHFVINSGCVCVRVERKNKGLVALEQSHSV